MHVKYTLSAAVTLAALSALPASAAITRLTSVDRQALLEQKFDVSFTTSSIPKCVRDAFVAITGTAQFSMAEPKQPFQSTDFGANASLPFYRLVFAGSSGSYYLIEALRGGFAPGSEVFFFKIETPKPKDTPIVIHQVHGDVPHTNGAIIFDHSPQSATLVWVASEDKTCGDLKAVRKAVADDKMNDAEVDFPAPKNKPAGSGLGVGSMPTVSSVW